MSFGFLFITLFVFVRVLLVFVSNVFFCFFTFNVLIISGFFNTSVWGWEVFLVLTGGLVSFFVTGVLLTSSLLKPISVLLFVTSEEVLSVVLLLRVFATGVTFLATF